MDHPGQPGAQRPSGIRPTTWSTPAKGLLILAAELARVCARRATASKARCSAPASGTALDRIAFRHPFYDRAVAGVSWATTSRWTPAPASCTRAPAYGVDDFDVLQALRHGNDEILNPVQGNGVLSPTACRFFGGLFVWKANPAIVDKLTEVGCAAAHGEIAHSYMHCWRHKTPIIYRATDAVVRRHGPASRTSGDTLRETALKPPSKTPSSSRPGARRACTR